MAPTTSVSPTASPTMSPSVSPTQYPTASDEYNSWIEMQYAINGLNGEEIEWIGDSLNHFVNDLRRIIEAAFDHDDYIEFRHIEVNVTEINDIKINKLSEYAKIHRERVMANGNLTLKSYTNCSSEVYCNYIVGADTGVTYFEFSYDEGRFEDFATDQLREYLDLMVLGVDATTQSATSSLQFSITDHSSEAVSLEVIGVTIKEPDYALLVLLGISGMFCTVGICAKIYESGVIPKLIPKVDNSLWTAWLAFGLQFWDFASDINLSFELWTHDDLWNERMILVAAIGTVAFTVIPYLCNLRIAAKIKSFVSKNETAATWCVVTALPLLHNFWRANISCLTCGHVLTFRFQRNSAMFVSLVVLTGLEISYFFSFTFTPHHPFYTFLFKLFN